MPISPPSTIELIDVGLDELDQLARSVAGLLHDEGGEAPATTTLRIELLTRLRRGRRAVLLRTATASGTGAGGQVAPIGHALWRPLPDRVRIEQFRIAPGHRRCGLGSACLQALTGRHEFTARPLEVRVLADNAAAIAFWRKAGFEAVESGIDPGDLPRRMLVLPR